MLFFLNIQSELNLPLEITFLKIGPVLNYFLMICPRAFLEGRCHLQPHRPCEDEVPLSTNFKVVVTGSGHKAAARLQAQLWLLGNQSPRESPVPGLSEWNVP